MAIEEPGFKRVSQDGDIEIRDYVPTIAAEVRVTGKREAAINEGFRVLADYIFGNNRQKAKVAMTAPVTQSETKGVKIAMTAPVTQSGDGQAWSVRFTMPARYPLDTLPQPNDPRVSLITIPSQRYAVVRFSGLAREKDIAEQTSRLSGWMAAHHISADGKAILARYDPPWTLWFARRNEVLFPIARP